MLNDAIRIPAALQYTVDDVAWHNGADERHLNRPSRSGFPRKHQPEDYLVLNEIAKKLGCRIVCALVLGEWDRNNRLRGVPHVTWDPDGWDRASVIDVPYTQACLQGSTEQSLSSFWRAADTGDSWTKEVKDGE